MNRAQRKEVVATLLKAGRRDLAQRFVGAARPPQVSGWDVMEDGGVVTYYKYVNGRDITVEFMDGVEPGNFPGNWFGQVGYEEERKLFDQEGEYKSASDIPKVVQKFGQQAERFLKKRG